MNKVFLLTQVDKKMKLTGQYLV